MPHSSPAVRNTDARFRATLKEPQGGANMAATTQGPCAPGSPTFAQRNPCCSRTAPRPRALRR
eukprot:1766178-Lingulodinium_polyedra.AAC.1